MRGSASNFNKCLKIFDSELRPIKPGSNSARPIHIWHKGRKESPQTMTRSDGHKGCVSDGGKN